MATDPPRRPPGRPPLDQQDPSVSIHFRLPAKQYDDLWRRAAAERTTVGDLLRHFVTKNSK